MPAPIQGPKLPRYDDDSTVLMKGAELNQIAERIERGFPLPGKNMTANATPGGIELSAKFETADFAPFAVMEITETTGGDYELTLSPGRVIVANPVAAANGNDGYSYFVPEIDGDPMDEENENDELPKITVSAGEGIFCKINRNSSGMVLPPVEIVTNPVDEDSDHYQPPFPGDSGHASEDDLLRILYLTEEDDEVVLKIWRKSDIQLTPYLWTGDNIGGGARVFKEHDEQQGIYFFRSLKGCWGADVTEDGDLLVVELAAENVGQGETAAAATLLIPKSDEDPEAEICDQKAKIKSLGQGPDVDERQIRITNEDEIARIHGNGKNGYLIFKDCAGNPLYTLYWEDGLVTSSDTNEITIGDCSSLT